MLYSLQRRGRRGHMYLQQERAHSMHVRSVWTDSVSFSVFRPLREIEISLSLSLVILPAAKVLMRGLFMRQHLAPNGFSSFFSLFFYFSSALCKPRAIRPITARGRLT